MAINRVIKEKALLEKLISNAVIEFVNETGILVEDITINAWLSEPNSEIPGLKYRLKVDKRALDV